ncbi:Bug family tripartite tricarboxylate transporter substrate binding protein [Achromobacter aloeverae]|uniref:Tripartite tricarboxylate transporter substrate binding protein n=1 Tax=Achromobacter aloeverae TaxID=1750518 RepID=A0A4Q1HQK1_9BURK|nr:tripartite tricarboxylate transporter substrate binding protein [Achromobacter aloeverae]RXN92676.1 tripartite tricarboxylate transporter substrate binding protein [Achromobacter aloeverae]
MKKMMTCGKLLGALALSAAATAAHAQPAWPGKVITLIVPYTAGGTADTLARGLGDALRASGTTVIIENKPGAGATLGTDFVARAKPDGNTLLVASTSPVTIYPHLAGTPYDPMTGLTPIASVGVGPVAIVATKALKVDDFAGLVAYAKSNPGKVTFAVPGLGSVAHLGMAALSRQAGIKMMQVPYRGGSQALTDGLGGVVDLMVLNTDVLLPHVASGALKPLAVMAPTRLEAWPTVPTMAELKLPKIQYFSNFGLFAPAGMKPETAQALQAAVDKAIVTPQYQDMLKKYYLQPGTGTGDVFRKQVKQEFENNGRLVKEENIKIE